MVFVVSTKTFISGDLKKSCGKMLMFSYLSHFRSCSKEDLLSRDKRFIISSFSISRIISRTFHFSGTVFIRRVQISGKECYLCLFCAWCFQSRLFCRSTCQQRRIKAMPGKTSPLIFIFEEFDRNIKSIKSNKCI